MRLLRWPYYPSDVEIEQARIVCEHATHQDNVATGEHRIIAVPTCDGSLIQTIDHHGLPNHRELRFRLRAFARGQITVRRWCFVDAVRFVDGESELYAALLALRAA